MGEDEAKRGEKRAEISASRLETLDNWTIVMIRKLHYKFHLIVLGVCLSLSWQCICLPIRLCTGALSTRAQAWLYSARFCARSCSPAFALTFDPASHTATVSESNRRVWCGGELRREGASKRGTGEAGEAKRVESHTTVAAAHACRRTRDMTLKLRTAHAHHIFVSCASLCAAVGAGAVE